MAERNDSFDAAFAQALEKAAAEPEGDSSETVAPDSLEAPSGFESDSEVEDEQAVEEDQAQSESLLEAPEEDAPEDDESLFEGLELPEEEESSEPGTYVLPGVDEPVSIEELKDGYLRQADYTRKTQELAASRKEHEKALQIYAALTERPQEFVRQLAETAGLIEKGAAPTSVVELPFRSDEEYQTEVQKGIDAALAEHPDVLAAQELVTARWIEQEFDRIEVAHAEALGGKKLSGKDREAILKVAYKNQTDNLELVFQALLNQKQDKARERDKLKGAAPAKPTGKATTQATLPASLSFDEAAAIAAEKLGIKLAS